MPAESGSNGYQSQAGLILQLPSHMRKTEYETYRISAKHSCLVVESHVSMPSNKAHTTDHHNGQKRLLNIS